MDQFAKEDSESTTLPVDQIREYVDRGAKMHSAVLEKRIELEQNSLEHYVKRNDLALKLRETQKRREIVAKYIELGVADILKEQKRMASRLLQDTERYGMLKERLTELKSSAKRVLAVQERIEDLTIYGASMSRDGIPKQLAAKLVPRLEREINTVIAQISEFRISIDPLTASMSIVDLTGKGQKLEAQMCCGSEKLIIELSLRAVIATMSCASAPGIMMLDESLNDFDANKRGSLEALFRTLARHFETVVVISHEDYVKGLVEKQIMPVQQVDWKSELENMPVGAAGN
jgi:DNA repair exonuclease SbcCD ATPase subunit